MLLAGALALGVGVGVVLGLLGAGGSILAVPILIYAVHLPSAVAMTSSLVVVGSSSAVAFLRKHARGETSVRAALVLSSTGIPAAYLGGRVSHSVPEKTLALIFGAVMLAAALAMARGEEVPAQARPHLGRLLLGGCLAGALTGLVGAGGGFLLVPTLVVFGGVPTTIATGTSLLSMTIHCAVGLAGKWGTSVPWRITLLFAACTVAGSFAGLALQPHLKPRALRRLFSVVVLAMGMVMIVRALA